MTGKSAGERVSCPPRAQERRIRYPEARRHAHRLRRHLDLQRDALEAADGARIRLGRSLKDLIAWALWLEEQGVGLRSRHEAIDTTTPAGKLTFHIFGALAEFERTLIEDRPKAGLAAARARGRKGGRRPALDEDRTLPIRRICTMMGISKPILYSYVRAADPAQTAPATDDRPK